MPSSTNTKVLTKKSVSLFHENKILMKHLFFFIHMFLAETAFRKKITDLLHK